MRMTGVLFAALMALAPMASAIAAEPVGESVSRPVSSAKTRKIVFDVYRQGKPFGQHEIVIAERGEEQSVAVKIDLRAGLGPITVFDYQHRCQELWRGGELQELDCSTKRDGKDRRVTARRVGQSMRVIGPKGNVELDGSVIPSSYWNMRLLDQNRMLNSETGEILPIAVSLIGDEVIDVGGKPTKARRYRLQSQLALDLWYDDQDQVVRVAFQARGQDIDYRIAASTAASRG